MLSDQLDFLCGKFLFGRAIGFPKDLLSNGVVATNGIRQAREVSIGGLCRGSEGRRHQRGKDTAGATPAEARQLPRAPAGADQRQCALGRGLVLLVSRLPNVKALYLTSVETQPASTAVLRGGSDTTRLNETAGHGLWSMEAESVLGGGTANPLR